MTGLPIAWRIVIHCSVALTLAFLLLPILAVVPASLNSSSFIAIPPHEISLRWYGAFAAAPEWRDAFLTSIEVGIAATAVSLVLGTMAALGLERLSHRARTLLGGALLAPMIVPGIVTAVAVYRSALDAGLSGTFIGLALSHALLGLPLVVINVGISLRAVDPAWIKAASGLGAGRARVFRTVLLPNIMPGILGGAVFAFITSFDEVVMTVFMAGEQTTTLPVKLWETIRLEFTPIVAVAATCVIVLGFLLLLAAQAMGAGRRGGAA